MVQTPETPGTLADRYLEEILVNRNLEAVEELFAPPSAWQSISLYGGMEVDSYGKLKRYYREELPKLGDDFTVETRIVDRQQAAIHWTATGQITQNVPGGPFPGRAFETSAVTTFGFSDEGIVELRVHLNELDLLPEISWAAVRGVIQEMRDGVIVLDTDDRIVHVNPAVVSAFDRDHEALQDKPIDTLLGDGNCPTREGCTVTATDDGRYYSVSTSALTDEEGHRIGRILVLRDVTDRRRRMQGLEVLNRVLRHDLRNALQIVRGRIEMAQEAADASIGSTLAPARERIDQLLSTADTARQVQTALDEPEALHLDLAEIVTALVDRARNRYPDATIETAVTDRPIVEAPPVIEHAIWEVLENACEHAGERPHVAVDLGTANGTAELAIIDDGPGLPAQERQVLGARRETDLEHGSGLGLWLAQWAIDAADGSLEFAVEQGTAVHVTLPVDGPIGRVQTAPTAVQSDPSRSD